MGHLTYSCPGDCSSTSPTGRTADSATSDEHVIDEADDDEDEEDEDEDEDEDDEDDDDEDRDRLRGSRARA
jgi:hypothetical protein